MVEFSESKVEYASHQLSLWYGECPHKCTYCFVTNYRNRHWSWAEGPLRKNKRALTIAKLAPINNVTSLVISFTNESLPPNEPDAMQWLVEVVKVLLSRNIQVKILTKNCAIVTIANHIPPNPLLTIGMSITSNPGNDAIINQYEPYASSMSARIGSLIYLHELGYRTWVSMEPLLPNTNIEMLLDYIKTIRPTEVWVGKGNYHADLDWANWREVAKRIIEERNATGINYQLKQELRELL